MKQRKWRKMETGSKIQKSPSEKETVPTKRNTLTEDPEIADKMAVLTKRVQNLNRLLLENGASQLQELAVPENAEKEMLGTEDKCEQP
jgi:hypothetical protein